MPSYPYLKQACNIIIVGASGDLTQRKLIPALFSLFCNGLLPEDCRIFGFARTQLTDEEFRAKVVENLTCRYVPEGSECDQQMEAFLGRCYYHTGAYANTDSMRGLAQHIERKHPGPANNLFYMAIPPSIFVDTANSIAESGFNSPADDQHWSRVVLEKPFGRDTDSSAELLQAIGRIFTEDQTYRIDHYLAKEVIQNLMCLRFANLIFEPIWNHHHIRSVSIAWSEEIGVEGRAGYFDHYGIIRDVMQNHLLQIMALIGMEQPIHLSAEEIRDEKVKLLRAVPPVELKDLIVGQYTASGGQPGYHDDEEVPKDSLTPTYAKATLHVTNPRWYGVPFTLSCGKALTTSRTEILIDFKSVPYSIFAQRNQLTANQLLIRVQPDEAIELRIMNKVPGLAFDLENATLDLLYKSAFSQIVPEAYERLLLDVMRGDRSLFLRDDELVAAWKIVTPAMQQLEEQKIRPLPYPFGSAGPMPASNA